MGEHVSLLKSKGQGQSELNELEHTLCLVEVDTEV